MVVGESCESHQRNGAMAWALWVALALDGAAVLRLGRRGKWQHQGAVVRTMHRRSWQAARSMPQPTSASAVLGRAAVVAWEVAIGTSPDGRMVGIRGVHGAAADVHAASVV